jgi:SAM-dependent methyltransferase
MRTSYDRVARHYADEIADELASKPFDRAFLDDFAGQVRDKGRTVELGAGPGQVAAYLQGRGVEVTALDLSPAMLAEAKRLFPELDTVVGDMTALPFADRSLAGAIAFYSIIHFDDAGLRRVFAEIVRVLQPSGLAAFAFHIGDKISHPDEWWDQPVSIDFRFLEPDHVIALLAEAGLDIRSSEEREPYATEVEFQSRRAFVAARR